MQFMLHHLMKTAAVKQQESVDMAADFQNLREHVLHDARRKFDRAQDVWRKQENAKMEQNPSGIAIGRFERTLAEISRENPELAVE